MKITRTAKELRSQSPAHHHQTWRTLRSAILCAELYEALRGGEKVVTVTESTTKGETHDVYKIEIDVVAQETHVCRCGHLWTSHTEKGCQWWSCGCGITPPKQPEPEWLSEALNKADGVYRP